MMCVLFFECSSRENRKLPVLAAWRGAGLARVENGSRRSKRMQHNMGLCCMNDRGIGAGVEFSKGYGAVAGRAWHAEQSYKNGEKAHVMVMQFSESFSKSLLVGASF
jgi:hypothetical protein